ncbi:MAG: Trm112 family protein [Thermoproteota archaeon]|nr:Trm112 family protein [Candidatus Brockarchaeota archaeon]
MKYRLMDLLACPIDKDFPLKLIVFQEEERSIEFKHDSIVCELYCGLKTAYVKETGLSVDECNKCMKREILNGILICNKCSRWYPIVDEIPQLLPDGLRDSKEDLAFLKKYAEKVPVSIIEEGKPFNLRT